MVPIGARWARSELVNMPNMLSYDLLIAFRARVNVVRLLASVILVNLTLTRAAQLVFLVRLLGALMAVRIP